MGHWSPPPVFGQYNGAIKTQELPKILHFLKQNLTQTWGTLALTVVMGKDAVKLFASF